MTNTSTASGIAAPAGLLSRFIGIITAPKETFQGVVARPRWFGMLALTCLTLAVLVGGYLFTQVGQDAWLDAASSSPFSGDISDQQYEAMQRMAGFAGYLAVAQMLIFVPVFYVVVAAILYAVFNAGMGGNATFKQLYTVVVHTGPIGVLAQLITVPLNYARGSMSSATNLAVLLPMLDETSFLGRLMGMIDIFIIWQLVVLAIGLAVLYKRRTQPIATALFVVYAIIAVALAAVMSRFGGSN
jgi:hypothetical protein